jgi:hypothetical protein
MRCAHLLLASALSFSATLPAADPPAAVDMSGFLELSVQTVEHREQRILDADAFVRLAATPGVLVLDTRSAAAYQRKHLAGAVHLAFSDFTEQRLAELIPHPRTTILIYCNNNILNDAVAFPSKREPLALNIATYINLYGYGYREVYELGSMVDVADPRFRFVTGPMP